MQFQGPFQLADIREREWLITNGLGGYASATFCGMNTRRYHGLLVAALAPPGQRTLLVSKLEEMVTAAGLVYQLATNEYSDVIHPEGYRLLTSCRYDGDMLTMCFTLGKATLEKRITLRDGHNTTVVEYVNTGTESCECTFTPLVNARDFHGETRVGDVQFKIESSRWSSGVAVRVIPTWMREGYWLSADHGEWTDAAVWHTNMFYCWEQRRGLTPLDNHFSPGYFTVTLTAGERVALTLSTDAPALSVQEGRHKFFEIPSNVPEEVRQLYLSTDSFIVQRSCVQDQVITHGKTAIAGYHWFGDWGRDTMIALPGLCLTTRRYAEAAAIFRTFATARRRGLLPNLFLDSGEGEAYNAVDASLWYLYAVDQYYRETADKALITELRPALEEIITYYRAGTDFGIHMDTDGLITTDAPGWQLTWMDAKVENWVVTPRMGKPVEINALWYHALRVMEAFADEFDWPGDYAELAEHVRESYAAYWYPQGGYLYDVLGETPDTHLRPNQIFAVSLPHSPLNKVQAAAVVHAVERALLTPYGLRTLAPDDPDYRGYYRGNAWERDSAYHQGTVWPWLIGPYIFAYLHVHDYSTDAKAVCRSLLSPLLAHVWDAGIGSISEIFDGDAPHMPKGTISQAWSVAEVLRAWEACRLVTPTR